MNRQETQCRQVVEYLENHDSITQRVADTLGIKRLASRICDLKKQNVPIGSKLIEVTNTDGSTSRVAQYWLIKEEICRSQHQDSARSILTSQDASRSPVSTANSGRENSETRTGKNQNENRETGTMTFEEISKIVVKLNKATQKQKDECILYLHFFDYLDIKTKCVRGMFVGDKFCGIEYRAKMECPKGKYYIIRRQK